MGTVDQERDRAEFLRDLRALIDDMPFGCKHLSDHDYIKVQQRLSGALLILREDET